MSTSKIELTDPETIITTVEDMNLHPRIIKDPTDAILAFGDLHGNAMKAIYLLIGQGVMKLAEVEDYARLMEIYIKPVSKLTIQDLDIFEKIINAATIKKPAMLIIIGDELADRGNNDWLTLLVLQKLNKEEVPYRIMLSNHGIIAVQSFAQKKRLDQVLGEGQEKSLHNLWTLVEAGKIEIKRLLDIVQVVYLEHLSLVYYKITANNELMLFTHAPVGLETVEQLAEVFKVQYDDSSMAALIQCIDKINKKASEAILGHRFTQDYFDTMDFNVSDEVGLTSLLWARQLQANCKIVPTGGNFTIKGIIHGHIGEGSPLVGPMAIYFHSLDTDFGKYPTLLNPKEFDEGICPVFCKKEFASLQLREDPSTPAALREPFVPPKVIQQENDWRSAQKDFKKRLQEFTHAPSQSPDREPISPPRRDNIGVPPAKRAKLD